LNLERFRKETTVAQNKKAIQLLRAHGMVAEAQFIIGLENETPKTIEDTFKWAMDWECDMANWIMYTPWPFSDLFEELGDKVEVRDYSRYNFVTPIMKPETMTRSEVLNAVMKNYARFYMRKSLFSYPWLKDKFNRKYMLGCLYATFKSGFERKFYDLGRIGYRGQKNIDFKFDQSKVLSEEELVQISRNRERVGSVYQTKTSRTNTTAPTGESAAVGTACGGGPPTDANGRPLEGTEGLPRIEGEYDTMALLGEERIDEFLDPRGFARQRNRAKKQSTLLESLPDEDEAPV